MNDDPKLDPRFGPYELLLELSRGMVGTLFLATSSTEDAGRVVVLRRIEPPPGAAPSVLVPLARTMRSAIGLEHPHLVPIVDVVAWNGRVAVVSAHVEGVMLATLGRLLIARKVASDVALAVRLARDVLGGLELLHDSPSYVPGGLAPDAVLVGFDGRARIFEPGLAASFARLPGVKPPDERRAYLGPEALATEPQAARRSDLYAVGVMLWEILQRRRRASGTGAGSRGGAMALEVPRLDAVGVPPALVEAVAVAVCRDPDARFASPSDMATALAEALPAAATAEAAAATVGRLFGSHSDTVRVRAALARHAGRSAKVPLEPAPAPAPAPPAHGDAPAEPAPTEPSSSEARAPTREAPEPRSEPREHESRAPFDSVPPSLPRPLPAARTAARQVGRCELFTEFAQGGMATVHLGRWVGAGGFAKTVAVKALHHKYAHDPEFVRMFLHEARVVARIRHPSVMPTLDLVEDGGELFIVMDYVHGVTLAHLQRQMPRRKEHMPIGMALRIMSDVLHGLHAAHEATDEQRRNMGIIHRDVSPENILVGVDGYARLIDFGIATALGQSSSADQGELKGKLSYMAPEQVRGEAPNRQSDVFAAAVVLWQIVTGRRLFKGRNMTETAQRILEQAIVPPSARRAGVGPELDAVVLRGLERSRATRWPDAEQMAEALAQCGRLPSHRELAEWVKTVAAERLENAARLVALVENAPVAAAEAELHLPLTVRPATAPFAPRMPALSYDEALFATEDGSLTELTSESAAAAARPRRRRGLQIAAAGVALAAGSVLVALVASGTRGDESAAATSARSAAPASALPPVPAPSASPSASPSAAPGPSVVEAPLGPSASAPDPSPSTKPSARSAPPAPPTGKVPWLKPHPSATVFVPRGI